MKQAASPADLHTREASMLSLVSIFFLGRDNVWRLFLALLEQGGIWEPLSIL